MNITRSDSTVLEARENNIGNLFLGIIFTIVGIGLLISSTTSPNISWLLTLPFLLVGIGVTLTRKKVFLHLDKQAGTGSIDISSIIKKGVVNFNLVDVQKIQLLEGYQSVQNSTGSQSRLTTSLMLCLKDGQVIDLSDRSSSFGFGILGIGRLPNQAIAKQIADYLNVPLDQAGPMEVIQQAFSSITQAIQGRGQEQPTSFSPQEPPTVTATPEPGEPDKLP